MGDNIETYLAVIRNVFSAHLKVHRKYDLKGSTVDREASEKEKGKLLPTLKDNDFLNDGLKISIGEEGKEALLETLTADVEFLTRLNIMDYSLLLGVHDLDKAVEDAQQAIEGDGRRRLRFRRKCWNCTHATRFTRLYETVS